MAARALDRFGNGRVLVRRMSRSARPGAVALAVACAALAAAVAKLDSAIEVQRTSGERRAVRVGFGVAARA
jgi:hypothetical protein